MAEHRQTFIVINSCTAEIEVKLVMHSTGKTESEKLENVKIPKWHASEAVGIHTVGGTDDTWKLEFYLNGKLVTRENKQCNLPDTGGATAIILYDQEFSIVTPDHGPCLYNRYDNYEGD